jgi:hypothetical protein
MSSRHNSNVGDVLITGDDSVVLYYNNWKYLTVFSMMYLKNPTGFD